MAKRKPEARADGRTVKLCVSIDGDTHQRLCLLAVMEGKTLTEIVTGALAPVAASVRKPGVSRKGDFHGPAEDDGPDLPRVAG